MEKTRLRLGKFWKERIEAGLSVPKGITIEHHYIKEYEKSLEESSEEI